MPVKRDLTLSALQIYLEQTLTQTADFIKAAKTTSVIAGFSKVYVAVNSYQWIIVIANAERLLVCIQNCLKAFATRAGLVLFGFNALCAVDSIQDCFREALYRSETQKATLQREARQLVEMAYRYRTKFFLYALAATHRNDPTLSSMWLLAAENLREAISLKRKCKTPFIKSVSYVKQASTIEGNGLCETSEGNGPEKNFVLSEKYFVSQCAARHYRYAAACEAIGRVHSHHHVANLYLEARCICADMESAAAEERIVYEGALKNIKHAAELAAAHAEDCSEAHLDPEVATAARQALRLFTKIPHLRRLMSVLKSEKASTAAAKESLSICQHTAMLPAWRKLVLELDEAVTSLETMLRDELGGVRDALPGGWALNKIQERAGVGKEIVHNLQTGYDRVAFYKQRAAQALQGARPSSLAHKCWTQAATLVEKAMKVGAEFWLSDAFNQRSEEDDEYPSWRPNYDEADTFASIADQALDGVSEYLDRARGAEAAHRDPREATWWREAAKALEQGAERLYKLEIEADPSTLPCLRQSDSTGLSVVLMRRENSFRDAAEYLHLAFKHRALPDADTRQNGTQVAVLYERAAELLALNAEGSFKCDPSTDLHTIVAYLLDLVALFNDNAPVPAHVMALYESGCAYAAGVSSKTPTSAPANWKDSCDFLRELSGRDADNECHSCCESESSESVYLHYDFEGSDGGEEEGSDGSY